MILCEIDLMLRNHSYLMKALKTSIQVASFLTNHRLMFQKVGVWYLNPISTLNNSVATEENLSSTSIDQEYYEIEADFDDFMQNRSLVEKSLIFKKGFEDPINKNNSTDTEEIFFSILSDFWNDLQSLQIFLNLQIKSISHFN